MMEKLKSSQWLKSLGNTFFGLDVRALALFRVFYAAILVTDLIRRFRNLSAHYTDNGVLPRNEMIPELFQPGNWTFHIFGGSYLFQSIIFALAGFIALSLFLGYRTRLCTILSWIFLYSLQGRNPLILHGGDNILLVVSFWAMFLPLGAAYSLDRALVGAPNPQRSRMISAATIAFTLQVCIIYWFAAILKTDPVWRVDGTAVYYALNVDAFTKPIANLFLPHPALMKFLSFATLYFEAFGPLLLFVPFFSAHFRTLAVLGFISLHAGFGLCIELGIFPFVGALAWVVFLPGKVFDKLKIPVDNHKLRQWLKSRLPKFFQKYDAEYFKTMARTRYENSLRLPRLASALVVFSILYVLLWNIRTLDNDGFAEIYPEEFDTFGIATGLAQEWALFAPKPMTDDGWYVIPATFNDGSKMDIHSKQAITWVKPQDVHLTYGSMRWSKYLIDLWLPEQDHRLSQYSEYLCDIWNEDSARPKKLTSFDIYFMLEETLPNYRLSAPERLHLWHQECFGHDVASK